MPWRVLFSWENRKDTATNATRSPPRMRSVARFDHRVEPWPFEYGQIHGSFERLTDPRQNNATSTTAPIYPTEVMVC